MNKLCGCSFSENGVIARANAAAQAEKSSPSVGQGPKIDPPSVWWCNPDDIRLWHWWHHHGFFFLPPRLQKSSPQCHEISDTSKVGALVMPPHGPIWSSPPLLCGQLLLSHICSVMTCQSISINFCSANMNKQVWLSLSSPDPSWLGLVNQTACHVNVLHAVKRFLC